MEDLRELGFVLEILESFLTAQLWKDRLAGLDRLNQQTPMFPVLRRTDYARKRAIENCASERSALARAVRS